MKYSIKTLCVTGNPDYKSHDSTGSVCAPIFLSSTFAHPSLGHSTGFDYSRTANPTREYVEQLAASLDGVRFGFAFSSGMAAISTLFAAMPKDAVVISSDDLYGGTIRLFSTLENRNGIKVIYTDTSDVNQLERALDEAKKHGSVFAVFIETPSNPTMLITDIRQTANLAHSYGAFLFADNTFLTPYFQQPIALGADLCVQSGTKFLSGHNDVLAGFLTTDNEDLAEKIRFTQNTTGAVLSPIDCYLVVRGIKTLALRMEASQSNAEKIAEFLSAHGKVSRVLYPGIESCAGFNLNKSQAKGSGAMMSFYVDCAQTAANVLERVKLIHFAESLGGVETLITYPFTQTHADLSEEDRIRKGITPELLRLSVGIEDADDLIRDLDSALF